MDKIPVWIDCDTGVDDACSLLYAGSRKELEIVGISTVAGNVGLELTTMNSLRICDLMEQDIPVYKGADKPWIRPYYDASNVHGKDGLGGSRLPVSKRQPEDKKAWDAIYEEAKKQNGRLELVAIGPLTNIANLITLHPDIKDYIKRILIMGGGACKGNRTPCAEFNIYVDPEAAQAVFRSGIKIYMFGLDVTEKAYVDQSDIKEISEHETKATEFFIESVAPRLSWYEALDIPGACLHDVCPVMYLIHPEIFKLEEAGVFVETKSDLSRGKTVTDLFSDHQFEEKNSFVALDVDRKAFVSYFEKALWSY